MSEQKIEALAKVLFEGVYINQTFESRSESSKEIYRDHARRLLSRFDIEEKKPQYEVKADFEGEPSFYVLRPDDGYYVGLYFHEDGSDGVDVVKQLHPDVVQRYETIWESR